jgi:hypothetical protein
LVQSQNLLFLFLNFLVAVFGGEFWTHLIGPGGLVGREELVEVLTLIDYKKHSSRRRSGFCQLQ